jgi:hypothetical protein
VAWSSTLLLASSVRSASAAPAHDLLRLSSLVGAGGMPSAAVSELSYADVLVLGDGLGFDSNTGGFTPAVMNTSLLLV